MDDKSYKAMFVFLGMLIGASLAGVLYLVRNRIGLPLTDTLLTLAIIGISIVQALTSISQASSARSQASTALDSAHASERQAEKSLKLELFERRYAVFRAVEQVIFGTGLGKLTSRDRDAFLQNCGAALFLFPKHVNTYIMRRVHDEILMPYLKETTKIDRLSVRDPLSIDDREELADAITRRSILMLSMHDEFAPLNSLFEPYLKVDIFGTSLD